MEKQILFSEILRHLQSGESAVLCTVIAASGSSPRGVGAAMAVFENGEVVGTVGGGAVEQHTAALAREVFQTGQSRRQAFCLAPSESADIGMVCGGSVTVQFAVLGAFSQNEALCRFLLDALEAPRRAWLVLQLDGQTVKSIAAYDKTHGLLSADGLREADVLPFLAERPVLTETLYAEPISAYGTVFVFGGGHVGAALVPILDAVGFHVTVYDSRAEIAAKEKFPQAKRVVFGTYENLAEKITITPNDYVVILTPGHIGDRAVLLQAMRTDAAYIGCIGSRSKIAATKAFLAENGIAEKDFERIHTPIGLSIGAETPQEIAVSIAAELIAHRANRRKEQEHGV